MKRLIYLFFLFFSSFSFSKESMHERAPFEIISNTYESKITKGRCIIEGTIYDAETNQILTEVTILSGTKKYKNDDAGKFKFSQKVSVKYLNFSKDFYTDSYVEDYAFKSKHRIKVDIYLQNQQSERQFNVKKPVVYCYSDKDLDFFKFELKPIGDLIFHYPKLFVGLEMINSIGQTKPTYTWNMSLKNNKLFENDTIELPYLFWESRQTGITFDKTSTNEFKGSLVWKKNLVDFLDSTLTEIGFNSKEKTDFITFWGPQMWEYNYYFIQFLQDDECQKFANYEIEPKPQKVNRIYMLFHGSDKYPYDFKCQKQVLKPLTRKGFYLVDWGGIDLTESEQIIIQD